MRRLTAVATRRPPLADFPDDSISTDTCFNQLDLGSYSACPRSLGRSACTSTDFLLRSRLFTASYETLRDKLMLAITEGAVGFGCEWLPERLSIACSALG